MADLLWDEADTDQPNRCLRKTLCQLRAALDSQTEPLSDHVMLIEPEWVGINPQAGVWLDVDLFERAYNHVQGIPGKELDPPDVQTLKSAADIYRGGLQQSWYQDWYLYERERLQHMYLIILDKLMAYCEAQGDYEASLAYGARILRCERARERTHRRLMRLHCLAGDRTAALRQYERCVCALNEELGVGPASRTEMLYERIRADQLSAPASISVEANKSIEAADSPLSEVLLRLKQLQAGLSEVQHLVYQDIRAVEQAMKGQR